MQLHWLQHRRLNFLAYLHGAPQLLHLLLCQDPGLPLNLGVRLCQSPGLQRLQLVNCCQLCLQPA